MTYEWIEIKSKADLPPSYIDVLVVLSREKPYEIKVMRHENGWWYGLEKGYQPAMYFKDSVLSTHLNEAKRLLNDK